MPTPKDLEDALEIACRATEECHGRLIKTYERHDQEREVFEARHKQELETIGVEYTKLQDAADKALEKLP